jgi:hypothetical protein
VHQIDSKWVGFFLGGVVWIMRVLWIAMKGGGVQMGSVVGGWAGVSVEYRPYRFWKQVRKTAYLESLLGRIALGC